MLLQLLQHPHWSVSPPLFNPIHLSCRSKGNIRLAIHEKNDISHCFHFKDYSPWKHHLLHANIRTCIDRFTFHRKHNFKTARAYAVHHHDGCSNERHFCSESLDLNSGDRRAFSVQGLRLWNSLPLTVHKAQMFRPSAHGARLIFSVSKSMMLGYVFGIFFLSGRLAIIADHSPYIGCTACFVFKGYNMPRGPLLDFSLMSMQRLKSHQHIHKITAKLGQCHKIILFYFFG